MSSLLLDGLDKLNIEYTFKSATKIYQEGTLSEQTSTILKNSEIIGKKIAEITGQTKFEKFAGPSIGILCYFLIMYINYGHYGLNNWNP